MVNHNPRPICLVTLPGLDLQELKNGAGEGSSSAGVIHQAEQGMQLLQALEKEGYPI